MSPQRESSPIVTTGVITAVRFPSLGPLFPFHRWPRQVMEHPVHDLPVTGLAFARAEAGVALEGYDLLAGSADYKITLFKSQGERIL